jgi:hypothetical protein
MYGVGPVGIMIEVRSQLIVLAAQKPRCLRRTPIGRYMAKEIYQ